LNFDNRREDVALGEAERSVYLHGVVADVDHAGRDRHKAVPGIGAAWHGEGEVDPIPHDLRADGQTGCPGSARRCREWREERAEENSGEHAHDQTILPSIENVVVGIL
jgi:hypothetical protein